jgi:RNA polymerase sigma factor (TIGR02999 family)
VVSIREKCIEEKRGEQVPGSTVQDQLVAEVYGELKRIAHAHNRHERFNATLQTTALVHEAWLRLAENDAALQPKTEAHLKALTSRVIRHVLVDYSRRAMARKRSPDANDLAEMNSTLIDSELDVDLLDLDEALHALSMESPRLAQIVEYRVFGGMSIPETAEVLDVSTRTVERDWRKARAYLLRQLRQRGD